MEQAGGGSAHERSGSRQVRRRRAGRGPLVASLAVVGVLAVAVALWVNLG